MNYITLASLNRQIKETLSDNIAPEIWVLAEISSIKMAGSGGHWYLDLVEKSNDKITAKSNAVIWASSYGILRHKFGNDLNLLLKSGNKVLIQGTVDFHELYGLKIIISDLDASATMGELELRRLATINKLNVEGHIGRNRRLTLPTVLQRIAVISSSTAAGYGDFINQLVHNPYKYNIHTTLFPSLMQGDGVEQELIAQLQAIAGQSERFDAVVITRGGGSKLDLEAFNSYQIAVAIATFPLPVLTGIGHLQDESVADLVAHTALKTPTTVAEFILNSFLTFESKLINLFGEIEKNSLALIQNHHFRLQTAISRIKNMVKQKLNLQNSLINTHEISLNRIVKNKIQFHQNRLDYMGKALKLVNVEGLLKKGFTITRYKGKAIKSIQNLEKGEYLSTELSDGIIQSRID